MTKSGGGDAGGGSTPSSAKSKKKTRRGGVGRKRPQKQQQQQQSQQQQKQQSQQQQHKQKQQQQQQNLNGEASQGGGERRHRGMQQQNLQVDEATRIRISRILQEFRDSPDTVYTFEADLTNQERAVAHEVCKKMGMTSKSSGRGSKRRLSISKTKKKMDLKEIKDLDNFSFSEEAKVVLQDLFTQYPPDDCNLGEESIGRSTGRADKMRERRDDIFCKSSINRNEIVKKMESFTSRIDKEPELRQIAEARARLPIASFRDEITSTIESNQVVLISGETGCGKTTQVPQFLLEHMWGKGKVCKLVCTQPRRISATSVAERISCERGEIVGDTVGYKIRLDSKGGNHSSIVFCTNGILLRMLVSKGNGRLKAETSKRSANDVLANMTHIIVDEIHERDRYSDFMLAIFRDILPSYPQLRLVLMSATLDADRFSQYFGGCSIIRVPGFTYPVKTFYLEDVLKFLKAQEDNHLDCASEDVMADVTDLTEDYKIALDEAINLAWLDDDFDTLLDMLSSESTSKVLNYQHSLSGVTPLMACARKGRVGDVCMLLSFGADYNLQANDGTTALEWAEREDQAEVVEIIKKQVGPNTDEGQEILDKYLSTTNPELVDVVLIEQLLRKICMDSKEGAILVFLPGWDEINRTKETLLTRPLLKDSSKYLIISLHSMVPSEEQKKVFRRPPPKCRKIVLSTNIAETAITIDDVVFVIDSGRMKEKNYDPYNNVSTLQSSWVSKASAKQREGRAGRCQPGICYHLYTKIRADSLPDFQVPEIKRIPIEELCLQVKLLDPNCKIEDFLCKLLDPPVSETIRNAVVVLQDIGALSSDCELTDLGEKLGCLPVHPSTSKMLFFAILMNCLAPALTLACASEYRDPFTLPMLAAEKERAKAAKAELASLFGGNSDQLAVVAAFECWKNAKQRGEEPRFCSQFFVSPSTMQMLFGMRKQLQNELHRHGFIPEDESCCSLNAHDPGVIQAVLVSGLYPMVGKLLPPLPNRRASMVETAGGDKVRLHPHSMNSKLNSLKSKGRPLVVYDEITRGDVGLNIRNCSVVGPLPLLLLASDIVVAPVEDDDSESDYEDESDEDKTEMQSKLVKQDDVKIMSSPDNAVKVFIDRWIPYRTTALDIAQIYCLRERLSAAVHFKVIHPREVLPLHMVASMHAIACILSSDGLPEVLESMESMDYLTSMVNATEIDQSAPRKKELNQNSIHYLKALFNHQPDQNPFRCNVATTGQNPSRWHGPQRPIGAGSNSGMGVQIASRGDSSKRPRSEWSR